MKAAAYGSRKFLFCCGLVLIATGLLIAGLIDADVWQKVTLGAGLGYIAGNVAQKATAKTTPEDPAP